MNNLEQERKTVQAMIWIYCKGQHRMETLCPSCLSLADYVDERLDRCPFGEEKPTCKNCTLHCYRSEEREAIKKVMRFAGPRMFFTHPLLALKHLAKGFKS